MPTVPYSPFVSDARAAISVARTYLNDESSSSWSDPKLMGILRTCHQELSAKLIANGMPVTRQQSVILTVPALVIGQILPIPLPGTPSNLIVPISMYERNVGEGFEDFIEMTQRDFVPDIDPTNELLYWSFQGQQIVLLGATSDREVQLRYDGSLNSPSQLTDSLGFLMAENYLGPRIAALAYMSMGDNRWKDFMAIAESNLDMVVKYNVNSEQGIPKRRMGYRRGSIRRIF